MPRWCGVIIYSDPNHKGVSTRLCGDVLDLGKYRPYETGWFGAEVPRSSWNDIISSVKVETLPGLKPIVTLYADAFSRGDKRVIDGSVSDLGSLNFNDVTSSIEVYPEDSGLVWVYGDSDYGAGQLQICTQLPDLSKESAPCVAWGPHAGCASYSWDKQISSIEIDKSYTCYPCS